MNLVIDPQTGSPRWNFGDQRLGPKEAFALEAAIRLQAKKLSLGQLKEQIISAANIEWSNKGNAGELRTLNDVKAKIGKSGKDWFFEVQRVAVHPDLLQMLIDQEGRGLTALSRQAGPTQAQRRKGRAEARNPDPLGDLIETLEQVRRNVERYRTIPDNIQSMCKSDLTKYTKLLKNIGDDHEV